MTHPINPCNAPSTPSLGARRHVRRALIDGSPAGARWDVLAPASGDVLGSGESVAEALEEALATVRRRKPWTPRHAWRPYPRRPGWLICSRCGVRVDLDPWRPFVKPDGAGERVYYDRRGDFVWPDEYAEPPCAWLPGYRLRVLWRRLVSRVTAAWRVQ